MNKKFVLLNIFTIFVKLRLEVATSVKVFTLTPLILQFFSVSKSKKRGYVKKTIDIKTPEAQTEQQYCGKVHNCTAYIISVCARCGGRFVADNYVKIDLTRLFSVLRPITNTILRVIKAILLNDDRGDVEAEIFELRPLGFYSSNCLYSKQRLCISS